MSKESRTRKTFLNARVNLIFYFLTLLLSFFSRKIFLDLLGADFVGLTTTLQNLLSFLNIAELGISGAIAYVLYKPLFEHNQQRINEIISVLGYLYRWVGTIIMTTGCFISLFLPVFFPETNFNLSIIYFAYYSFLTSSLIGYFINYRQTLLSADQKNYVVTAYFQTGNILMTIIQMISAYYTQSYYLWITITLSFGIIYSIILNWKINQVYPWLKSEIKIGKNLLRKYPEVIKLTKQIFVHKLGGLVQIQLTPFLVYAFISLEAVALFTNYTLLIDKIKLIFTNFLGSTTASVGNLIAENNKERILKTYWELLTIRFFFVGISTFVLYNCTHSFILLWLGENYVLSNTILILVLITFSLNIVRGTTDEFISGYGLFGDIYSPIIEIIIFALSSLLGGYYWGIEGLLLGSIISTISVIYCWKPYYLFTKGFKISIWKYWISFSKYILLTLLCFYISSYINTIILSEIYISSQWYSLIIKAFISLINISFIYYMVLYVATDGMKNLTQRILILLLRKQR